MSTLVLVIVASPSLLDCSTVTFHRYPPGRCLTGTGSPLEDPAGDDLVDVPPEGLGRFCGDLVGGHRRPPVGQERRPTPAAAAIWPA